MQVPSKIECHPAGTLGPYAVVMSRKLRVPADRLASLRDEPGVSEAALRAAVAAALRARRGPGAPPARAIADGALRRIDRAFTREEPAWFVARRRIAGAVDAFVRSRLAWRLFGVARSRIVSIGGPDASCDAVVEGRHGERYGVCLALTGGAVEAAERARCASLFMIGEHHAIVPVVLVFSVALGGTRTFRSLDRDAKRPERSACADAA
jgi:hypothetical protein